jgi:hypothetical protein
MFEKQAYEAAKLENDLKRTELDSINVINPALILRETGSGCSALNRQEVLDLELHRCASCDKAKPLDVDKELEQQIKAMDLSKAQKEQMIQLANDRSKELRKHIENMKEKLRQRKDRKKPGSLTADEEQNLSDEEKRKLLL